MQRLSIPIKGIMKGATVCVTPSEYSTVINNVRPFDAQGGRMRLGQRPGLVKTSTTCAGSETQPVVEMCSVASIL